MGLIVGNLVRPGSRFSILIHHAGCQGCFRIRRSSPSHKLLFNSCPISFPNTIVDAFTRRRYPASVCSSLFSSVLLCRSLGRRGKPLVDFLDALTRVVFRIVAILMRFAPIGGVLAPWRSPSAKYGPGFLGPSRKVDCYALLHVLSVRNCPAGGNRSALAGFGNPALPLVSSRRNSSSLGH